MQKNVVIAMGVCYLIAQQVFGKCAFFDVRNAKKCLDRHVSLLSDIIPNNVENILGIHAIPLSRTLVFLVKTLIYSLSKTLACS
jgi:hypothetical protein